MTTEARILADAQHLPLVVCPGPVSMPSGREAGCDGPPCPVCGGTGQVRSDLYRALEMALTVPCSKPPPHTFGYGANCDECAGTGRVLRESPGEVPCPCIVLDRTKAGVCEQCYEPTGDLGHSDVCSTCGGSGTVPGTDEASVVARDEGCGRLLRVYRALPADGTPPAIRVHLQDALWGAIFDGRYPDALVAAAEAVEAVVAQGVRT